MRRRPVTIAVATLALAGLLGACSNGGGSDDGDTDAGTDPDLSAAQQAHLETELEFARCMRDRGIEGFPDPQVDESGVLSVGVPWEADQEEWQAAADACSNPEPEEPAPDEAAAGWERVVPGGD